MLGAKLIVSERETYPALAERGLEPAERSFGIAGGLMQQATSRQLYAYWDSVRNGRLAPSRFEIETSRIAPLLPETFIAECDGLLICRFRLAGTKICEQFGRELRGNDLLALWEAKDRTAFASLLRTIAADAAVGQVLFRAYAGGCRQAKFELVLMPLTHHGEAITRLLGAITAVEPPFWLGSDPLIRQEAASLARQCPETERGQGDPRVKPRGVNPSAASFDTFSGR